MKYFRTITSSLVTLLCIFLLHCSDVSAQEKNEKIIFNLTEGKFDNATIPYVQAVIVAGVPIKNKENVDAIRLVVTRVTSGDEQALMAKRYLSDQLFKQMKGDSALLKFLQENIKKNLAKTIPKETVADWADQLKEKNMASLAEKFAAAAALDSGLADKISELTTALDDEISTLKKELAKKNKDYNSLQQEIAELAEDVEAPPFFDKTWLRGSDGDDEFTFTMPDKFKMKEKYAFTFTIFKQNKVTVPIDELLNPLVVTLDDALKTQEYYKTEPIRVRVSATIKTIEDNLFGDVHNIDATSKDLTPNKGFGLPASTIKDLTSLIETFYNAQFNKKETEKDLTNARIKIANALGSTITVKQRDNLLKLIEVPGNEAKIKGKLDSLKYSKVVSDNINANYLVIVESKEEIVEFDAAVVKSRSNIQKIFDDIKRLYTQVGKVTTSVSTGSTDIDGIMLSTTYGIGVVSLDPNTIEWFRFFGVNIRFDGFDNRLPGSEAYHSYMSRFSFMIGISTTSDMQYKGNKLENTRLGIKPVIGFNWEPVKHMNIGAGVISFIQESPAESQKDPKIRPYISLSFDFNLFNYLIQKQ